MNINHISSQENSLPHFEVVICTPGDILHSPYVQSLMETVNTLFSKKISFIWLNEYFPYVAQARDLIINGGWEGNGGYKCSFFSPSDLNNTWKIFNANFTYDQMIWIDNDISWSPDQFFSILSAPQPIVTGAYLMNDTQLCVRIYPKNYQQEDFSPLTLSDFLSLKKDELHLVDTCGMGFLKVRSGVIESFTHPVFNAIDISKDYLDNLSVEVFSIQEDTSFCLRARQAGFSIYLDPSIRVTHHKKNSLSIP